MTTEKTTNLFDLESGVDGVLDGSQEDGFVLLTVGKLPFDAHAVVQRNNFDSTSVCMSDQNFWYILTYLLCSFNSSRTTGLVFTCIYKLQQEVETTKQAGIDPADSARQHCWQQT